MRYIILIIIFAININIAFGQHPEEKDSSQISELKLNLIEKSNQIDILNAEKNWYHDALTRQTTLFIFITIMVIGLATYISDKRISSLINSKIKDLKDEISESIISKNKQDFEIEKTSLEKLLSNNINKTSKTLLKMKSEFEEKLKYQEAEVNRNFAAGVNDPETAYIWYLRTAKVFNELEENESAKTHLKNTIIQLAKCNFRETEEYLSESNLILSELSQDIFQFEIKKIRMELDRLFNYVPKPKKN